MRPMFFVNFVCQNPFSSTENCIRNGPPPTTYSYGVGQWNSDWFPQKHNEAKRRKAIDMRLYWVIDRVNQNQFLIYWRPGANNVGDYVSKHHSPAHHQTMSPNIFVNLVCQSPSSYTENCLQRLSLCLQRGGDNPTIISSIVRYDSNCSHRLCGTSKPTFSSPKGYLTSITSISKI